MKTETWFHPVCRHVVSFLFALQCILYWCVVWECQGLSDITTITKKIFAKDRLQDWNLHFWEENKSELRTFQSSSEEKECIEIWNDTRMSKIWTTALTLWLRPENSWQTVWQKGYVWLIHSVNTWPGPGWDVRFHSCYTVPLSKARNPLHPNLQLLILILSLILLLGRMTPLTQESREEKWHYSWSKFRHSHPQWYVFDISHSDYFLYRSSIICTWENHIRTSSTHTRL